MDYEREREQLVDRLRTHRELSERTLSAIGAVPRHEFVPESNRSAAYRDTPLPIGQGQTISAPHMVAVMIELLELQEGEQVLEIGTGCGYHAAVTAEIVGSSNVYSVEYHPELAETARKTLENVGYGDISITTGDGRDGWPTHSPYDAIYLTCAADSFPDSLCEQLRDAGIILGPIRNGGQNLLRGRLQEDGSLDITEHGQVRFVPLK